MKKSEKMIIDLRKGIKEELKNCLVENHSLSERVSKIKKNLERTRERKAEKYKRILRILKDDIATLSHSIKTTAGSLGFKFLPNEWIVKDESALDEIRIEFQLYFPLAFPGRYDFKRDGREAFATTTKQQKIQSQIEKLNKKYEIKFIFTCKVIRT